MRMMKMFWILSLKKVRQLQKKLLKQKNLKKILS